MTSYVVILSGEVLTPASTVIPAPAVAVWFSEGRELLERSKRLLPRCVVLDCSNPSSAGLLALLRRDLESFGTVVASVGDPGCAETVDERIAAEGGPSGVASLVRYCFGQPARRARRVALSGIATLEVANQPIAGRLRDLSEDGLSFDVPTAAGAEVTEAALQLSGLGTRDLCVRFSRVWALPEPAGRTLMGGQFVELGDEERSQLRILLLRQRERGRSPTEYATDRPVAPACGPTRILGLSAAMRRVNETIDRVAPTDVTVLLLGETGTGKELAARALHDGSTRCKRPFVAVNCAALPESLVESELFGHEPGAFTGAVRRKLGRIEQASGGTLFLDEIGDLPPNAQAKLLRALQERAIQRVGGNESIAVDVRLIAATNQDLEAGMANNHFRRDLFFRLNVVTLQLPALRDRLEDIPLLTDHFLAEAQLKLARSGITLNPHAHLTLQHYPWPGNVRELKNVCTRLVVLSQDNASIGPEHLNLFVAPDLVASPLPTTDLRDILDFCEREIVRRMLDRNGGNRSRTARDLGISRQAIQQKLARFREGRPRTDRGTPPE
jgi:DNA-binding NtrC family response regulator